MNFEDASSYFRALEQEKEVSDLAIIPMQMLADMRGVTRGAVVAMVNAGQLQDIKIGKTRYIQASSYIALRRDYNRRVQRVRDYLEDLARKGVRSVTYDPVMSIIGLRWQTPADRSTIGGILGDISTQTWKEHKILLSVLVHNKKAGKTRPGDGFFGLNYWGDFPHWSKFDLDDLAGRDALVEFETDRVLEHYVQHQKANSAV